MAGYTKLFNSILHSTIWSETNETRIVWITMLAMSDKNGEVQASIPGLARAACVSLEDTETALTSLMSPDRYSRTEDHEGRRIESVEGGWVLLNHAKYRAKMNEEERREYNAAKKREQRERDKKGRPSMTVNDTSALSAHSDSDSEADSEASKNGGAKAPPCPPEPDMIDRIWPDYPKKGRERSTRAKARAAWQRIPKGKRPEPETILDALRGWKKCDEWNRDHGAYVPGLHIWIKGEAYLDPPHEIRRTNPADLPSWAK